MSTKDFPPIKKNANKKLTNQKTAGTKSLSLYAGCFEESVFAPCARRARKIVGYHAKFCRGVYESMEEGLVVYGGSFFTEGRLSKKLSLHNKSDDRVFRCFAELPGIFEHMDGEVV